MSRVRVYELAKEAGLKSKELADKLIAMGYPIKSHSSTVDDDMAADIRQKIQSNVIGGAPEGRIDLKERTATVKRRPKTVVRRRSKAQKEETLRQAEEAEQAALLEEEVQVEPAEVAEDEYAQDVPIEETVDEMDAEIDETEPVSEESDQVAAVDEPAVTEPELTAGEEVAEGDVEVETPKEEAGLQKEVSVEGKAPGKVVKKEPVRETKKLAKVIGRVEIPTSVKKTTPAGRRQARPSSARPARPARGTAGQDPAAHTQPKQTGKGKKKGKRVVAIKAEADTRVKKPAKGNKRSRGKVDFTKDRDVEFMRPRKGKKKKGRKKEKVAPQPVAEAKAIKRRIKIIETITVGELAKRMGVKANEVIGALMKLGVMATLNQALDFDTATLVAADFGYEIEQAMTEELEVEAFQEEEKGGETMPRPPVVTVMGHVDHGKTSILDAIRKTDVAEGEAGGITQHIGAYHVQAPSGDLTFVDTPGHAAFTEMRSRGAKVTDIVVLVVAADDGVMDQTKEAIAHSRAAEVPIVVAVNKIDKDNADPERVKRELGEFGLLPEEWGGDTMYCDTSAKKGLGINELLEAVQLQAEILELTADPVRKAKGTVIEAQLHKGRGPVATVLIQEGTLRVGDNFVAGMYSGKVRMLINDRGEQVREAGPTIPVEIQGISGVPQAGDEFVVLSDEKMAKAVSGSRQMKARESELASVSKVSLDNLFEKMAEQEVKELRVILRADVQGTLQAFGQAAEKLSTSEIKVRVLHEGTGSVTDNDIHLAAASDAIIIGFNVRPAIKVKDLAEREQVDVRSYDVIYHALEDIEKAMVGMLEPIFEERVIGTAEVRDTFQVPKIGVIAGCAVIDGKIERNAGVRVLRDGVVVYTGKISSLKRFKDDVKEVSTGFECGIGVENFNDIKLGDNLEAFVMDEIEATL